MKKHYSLSWLFSVLFIIVSITGYSQITTVADGNVSNDYIPISGRFANMQQHQQVIYPASMLSDITGGTISSMTFYLNGLPAASWNCPFTVRLGITGQNLFQNMVFISTDNTVVVYSGLLSINASTGQMTINFTTPFVYTGGNLLLDVQNTTGGTNSVASFFGVDNSSSSLYSYIFMNYPWGPFRQSFIPKTTFTFTGGASCLTPTDFNVDGVDATSVTLSWHARSENAQYQVCCVPAGTDITNVEWTLVSDTMITFNNLISNIMYTAYVRSNCGTEVSGYTSISFHTECGGAITDFPWTEGFEGSWDLCHAFGQENSAPQCWEIYNGGTTEHTYGDGSFYWKLNQNPNQVHSGQHSAVCFTEYATDRHNDWLISPMMSLTGNQRVSFFAQNHVNNTTLTDEISVWISDENVQLQAPTNDTAALPGFTQLFQTEIPVGDFQNFKVSLAGYSGNRYIAFVRRNSPNSGWNLCLDDVTVENIPPCETPIDLSAAPSAYNAQLSWNAESNSYNLYYKTAADATYNTIQEISLNNDGYYLLADLVPGTTYEWYVEAICNDQSVMSSAVSTFNTTCGAIVSVPQTWDFDHSVFGGTSSYPLPACWNRQENQIYPYVYHNQNAAYSGTSCLFCNGTASDAVAVLPMVNVNTLPINTLQLRFYAKALNDSAFIEVGVMTDLTDTTTFELVHVVHSIEAEYDEYKVSFENVVSSGEYIVIRINPNGGNFYIDDMVLEEIPACDMPVNLHITNLFSNSVRLNWSSAVAATNVYYQEAGTGVFVLTDDSPVYSTSYILQNLIPNTNYSVYVSSVCQSDSTEISSSVISFTTDCEGITAIPNTWDFENNNTSGTSMYPLPACWKKLNASLTSLYVSNAPAMAHSGTHCLYSVYPNNQVVVSPVIDRQALSLNTMLLSFYAKTNYGRNAILEAGVVTDCTEASSFVSLASFNLTSSYQYFEVPLVNFNGEAEHFAFRLNADNDYVVIDDVVLDTLPQCIRPANLACVSTSFNSVTLMWNPAGGEENWDVVYGVHGFDPDIASPVLHSTSNEIVIGNLSDTSAYDFYVRANCGEDGVSPWKGLYSLTPGRYNMPVSGTNTIHTCDAVIYDNGGADDFYSGNCDSYLVIYPDNENSYVEIYGTLMAESSYWDYLVVYDGAGTSQELYHSSQDGSSMVDIPIITSQSGPLTIYFHSDMSMEDDGFEIHTRCVSCVSPILSVNTVGTDSVTLAWSQSNQTNATYDLVYGPVGFSPDSVQPLTLTNIFIYTIQNLTPNTAYDVYIRMHCDEMSYSNWQKVVFSTLSFMSATLPYSCNFENAAENAMWITNNGDQINRWYIDTAVNHTVNGNFSLYISDDNGLTNSYETENHSSYVWAYRDFQFPTGDEFVLSFDWKGIGEGYNSILWDYLSVYIGTPMQVNAGADNEPEEAVLLGKLCNEQTWTNVYYILGGEYANTTKRLYFFWKNDNNDGTNPPVAIDNIILKTINCAQPINDLTITDITDSSARITIHATDENAMAWQLRYDNELVTVTNDTSYIMTHLTPASQYVVYVRSICNNGDTSLWTSPNVFVTACHSITASSLPYFCDFEHDNIGGTEEFPLPVCWQRAEGVNDAPSVYYYGTAGNRGLQSGSDPANNIVMLPEIDTSTLSISSLMLNFQALIDCYSDYTFKLEVGIMSDPNDPLTFVSVDTVSHLSFEFAPFEVSLENYTGTGTFIAFRFNATGGIDINGHYSFANIFIDDLTLDYIPNCRKPNDLMSLGTTDTSVRITWTPEAGEHMWQVKMGTVGFNPEQTGMLLNANSNELLINNLQPQTAYDFYVRAYCGDNSYSGWTGPLTLMPGTYNMKTSGIDTLYTCDMMIYDNGGSYADYADRCDAYLILYPDEPDKVLEISGTILADEYFFDYLVIYDGAGAGEDIGNELYYSHQEEGVQTTIPPVMSTTGPLTLYFHSDYTVAYAGFELAVSCVSCVTPTVSVSGIYLDSAVVSWTTPIQSTHDFELVYGPAGFNPNAGAAIQVSGSRSYPLTGLTINNTYDVYVRSICGSEYTEWSNVCGFSTLSGLPASVPYTCDFENMNENLQWKIVNGTQTNKWYIHSLGSESTALYVSSNNGVNNTYNVNMASNVWAYRDFIFPDSAEFTLSFDWLCHGENLTTILYDYFEVFIGDPTDVTAGSEEIPGNLVSLGKFNMEDSWTRSMVAISNEYAGHIKRLYILWHNDNNGGENPAAAIDNISIDIIHCVQPVGVDITNVTSHSAHVSITQAEQNVSAWQLRYDNQIITVVNYSDTDLLNLQAAREYNIEVRSICMNGDTSMWYSAAPFVTACGTIGTSALPYVCDFENNNFGGTEYYPLPACWQRLGNADNPYVSYYSYSAHQGDRYLTSGIDADNFFVILPEINTDELSINELQVRFYAKLSDFTGSIDVGVMTNPNNSLTFTPVSTISNLTNNYMEYQIPLSQYNGNGSYIALRLNSVGGTDNYGYHLYALIFIDDLTLDYIPDCPEPAALNQNNISALSADLSWSNVADFYKVYYREVGVANYTVIDSVTLTNGVYTLNNLSPLTSYEWYVASICANGSVIPSHTTGSFTTLCEVVGTFPYQESFENGLGCWIPSVLVGGQDCQWQIENTYGAYQSQINPADGNSFAEAFYYGSGNVVRLSSPSFDLSSLQEPYIKFYHIQLSWGSDQDYLKIYYKTSGTAEPVLLVSYDNSIYPWRLDSLALPNPSANYQLLFDAHLNYGYGVGVDKVVIYDHHQGGEQPPVVELPVVITDTATSITEHSAVLNGTIIDFGNQNITARGFEWKLTSGGTYTQVADTGTASSMTYPLTGLSDNTLYTYRAFVSTADTTVYGAEEQFTTLEEIVIVPCETPTNLQVSSVSATSAEVSWMAGGEESTWVVEHKLQNESEWQIQSVSAPQVTLTDLVSSSTYHVRVKAVCTEDDESDYIDTSFTTSVGINDMSNWVSQIVLMPNPADNHIEILINSNVKVDKVEIYNAMGQWVQTFQLHNQQANISLENMSAGMYFVRVYSDCSVVTKKFIKR